MTSKRVEFDGFLREEVMLLVKKLGSNYLGKEIKTFKK